MCDRTEDLLALSSRAQIKNLYQHRFQSTETPENYQAFIQEACNLSILLDSISVGIAQLSKQI
jgi:hypothetical protein